MPKSTTRENKQKKHSTKTSSKSICRNNNIKPQNKSSFRSRKKKKDFFSPFTILGSNNINEIDSLKIDYYFRQNIFNEDFDVKKAIIDIYPYFKEEISIFKPTILFNEKTKPIDFFIWMINCIKDVCSYDNFNIEYNKETKKYQLTSFIDMSIDVEGKSVSLYFIENLYHKSKKYYYLFIDFLSILNKEYYVPFWFSEDNFISYHLEMMEEEIESCDLDEDEQEEYKIILNNYKFGFIETVRKTILSNKTFKYQFKEKLKGTKPFNNIEKIFDSFLIKHSEKIFQYADNFHNYINISEEESEGSFPPSPFDYACIQWDLSSDDIIGQRIEMDYQEKCNENEIIPFRKKIINGDISSKETTFIYDYLELLDDIIVLEKEILRA